MLEGGSETPLCLGLAERFHTVVQNKPPGVLSCTIQKHSSTELKAYSGEEPAVVNQPLLSLWGQIPHTVPQENSRPSHSRELSLCLFLGCTTIIHGCITAIRTQELNCHKNQSIFRFIAI